MGSLHVLSFAQNHILHARLGYLMIALPLGLVAAGYLSLQNKQTLAPAPASTTLQLTPTTEHVAAPPLLPIEQPATTPTSSAPSAASTSGSASQESTNNSTYSVTVNGQPIDVPPNTSVQQSVPTQDGQGNTNVSISNIQSSNGQTHSYNFSSTNSHSSTSSSTSTVIQHRSSP